MEKAASNFSQTGNSLIARRVQEQSIAFKENKVKALFSPLNLEWLFQVYRLVPLDHLVLPVLPMPEFPPTLLSTTVSCYVPTNCIINQHFKDSVKATISYRHQKRGHLGLWHLKLHLILRGSDVLALGSAHYCQSVDRDSGAVVRPKYAIEPASRTAKLQHIMKGPKMKM